MIYNTVEILLVEDDSDDAEITIRELKKNNIAHNLFHVKDGEEALQFIFASGKFAGQRDPACPPKLVLLDINMPKVNGIEVLQQLRAYEGTRHMPVVILSSSNEARDIKKSYAAGANSYIVKQVSFDKFAEAIRILGSYWLLLNQPPV